VPTVSGYFMTFSFTVSSCLVCVFLLSASSIVNTASDTKPVVSQTETALVIGSGPLPARAPPEKKSVMKPSSELSKVASQPAAVTSVPAPVVQQPPPVKTVAPAPVPAPVPPPPVKPVVSSTSLPKLTQPMPLASRPPLANVSRGVAAAFLEQEDDEAETATNVKTSLPGISTSGTTLPGSALQAYTAAKKVETSRLAAAAAVATKPPAPVPPPATTAPATKSAMPTVGDFVMGLSGMSFSDMVVAAQTQKPVSGLPFDRGDAKGLAAEHAKGRPSSYRKRPRTPTDSKGRKKLEIGRNVM